MNWAIAKTDHIGGRNKQQDIDFQKNQSDQT